MEWLEGVHAGAVVALALGLLLAAAVVAVAAAIQRRRYRPLAAAFEPGSSVVRAFSVEGRWSGYLMRCTLQERTQSSPGGMRLVVPVLAPFRWRAVAVGRGERLLEMAALGLIQLGLLRDVEVGDPVLDRVLRFAAEHPQNLAVAFQSQSVRAAMRRLLALPNFRSLDVRRNRASVQFQPRTRALDENPEVLRARMTAVAELLSAVGCSPALGRS